jgi:DNA polymerase (family 10)
LSDPVPPEQRTRREFARRLWRLADVVQASDRRRSFRARAFRAAVWSLDDLPSDLDAPAEEMRQAEGIGAGIVGLIDEFRSTGTLSELQRLDGRYPSDVRMFARLPRMTPGRLEDLKALGVDTAADLMAAIDTEALSTIDGIGPATLDRWAAILSLPPSPGAVPAHQAAVTASMLRRHLARHLPDDEVQIAGAVRRLDEWVDRIDLVVVTDDPARVAYLLEESAAVASSASEPGWAIDLVTHDRIPAAVRLTDRQAAGTALVRWTGPEPHVRRLGISDDAPHPTEEDVYRSAGMPWIPPPARVRSEAGHGSIRLADIRGDLHVHTESSPDGHMSLVEAGEHALARGYRYMVVTDHTIGLRFGGLDAGKLRQQRELVEEARRLLTDIHIFHGAEINIDAEGGLDLDDETLAWLDFVVAGAHSHFDLPKELQTARLVKAVRHPAVSVLAHPTGRRIGIRPGFDVDLHAVFEAAVETGTALEVNGHRDRMDLPAEFAAEASRAGVWLAADSDAHRPPEFDNMAVAVGVLQRAGVRKERVINAAPSDSFLEWVEERRRQL